MQPTLNIQKVAKSLNLWKQICHLLPLRSHWKCQSENFRIYPIPLRKLIPQTEGKEKG